MLATRAARRVSAALGARRLHLPPLREQQPSDPVNFVRCLGCFKPITGTPLLCSACGSVSYCSPACQARAASSHTESECAAHHRYMQRDVRVTLGAARPAWLAAAMDHRSDGTTRELLEQMGVVDDPAYRLLDMLDAAPNPHRHLVEPLPDAPWRGRGLPDSWESYYEGRGLSRDSPVALLLSFPLTLSHILGLLGDAAPARDVTVHVLGAEKELHLMPTFGELAVVRPERFSIELVGPVGCDLPDGPVRVHERVTVRAHRGLYHSDDVQAALEAPPDLVVALNAGLAVPNYEWAPTLRRLAGGPAPFFFTDYSEYSAEKGVARAREHGFGAPSVGVDLNPFRAPLLQPRVMGGAVGFPWLSNGFVAGWH